MLLQTSLLVVYFKMLPPPDKTRFTCRSGLAVVFKHNKQPAYMNVDGPFMWQIIIGSFVVAALIFLWLQKIFLEVKKRNTYMEVQIKLLAEIAKKQDVSEQTITALLNIANQA